MISSRAVLHGAALILPLAAVAGLMLAARGFLREAVPLIIASVLAAQCAALGGRVLLARSAQSHWMAALLIGLGMALLTHALFGRMYALWSSIFSERGDLLLTALVFSWGSFILAGFATLPLTMAVCVVVHHLHRKELARAAV
ncbi:MAG: hypothetical protein JNN30_19485 [Rhodanobacteraceae bacterium]|nr:hypothetical protein [Rhodanobacteraceae bacterium]